MVSYVQETLQLQRLMGRNHLSKAEAQKRMASQLSIEEKVRRADYVIDNTKSLAKTRKQVLDFIATML
jgi:dephospho-CoA kinase